MGAACSRETNSAPPAPRATIAEAPAETGGAFTAPNGAAELDVKIAREQELAKKTPRDAAPLVRLARLWFLKARDAQDDGLYLFARDAVRRAKRIAPDDLDAMQVEGALFLQDHAFSEARALAKVMVQRKPRMAEAWGILSDASLEMGDYDAAMEATQQMVDLRPDSRSYARAAWLEWLQGDWAAAEETMQLATSALPGERASRAWLITQSALMKFNMGKLDEASALARDALVHAPDFVDAHLVLARVLRAKGDVEGAVAHAREAAKPARGLEAQWLLAEALAASSHASEAPEAYAKLERMGKIDPRTLALYLAGKGGRCAEAVQLAQGERAKRPDVISDDALAWAQHCAKDDKAALESATRALRLGTRDARMRYHRGMIALALGDQAGARAALSDALAINAYWDPREVADARAALRSLPAAGDAGTETAASTDAGAGAETGAR